MLSKLQNQRRTNQSRNSYEQPQFVGSQLNVLNQRLPRTRIFISWLIIQGRSAITKSGLSDQAYNPISRLLYMFIYIHAQIYIYIYLFNNIIFKQTNFFLYKMKIIILFQMANFLNHNTYNSVLKNNIELNPFGLNLILLVSNNHILYFM